MRLRPRVHVEVGGRLSYAKYSIRLPKPTESY